MSLRKEIVMCGIAISFFTGCPTPQSEEGLKDYRIQAKREKNGILINGNGVLINGNGILLNGNGASLNGNGTVLNGNGAALNGNGSMLGSNGTDLGGNGSNLGGNGTGLSATGASGTGLDGLTLTSTTAGPTKTPVPGFWLVGSELNANINGQTVRGAAVTGIEFHYSYQPTGATTALPFTVRISSAGLDPTALGLGTNPNDVWMYNLEWIDESAGAAATWKPFCLTENGSPDQALLLSNRWDLATGNRINQPTFITFACRDFALAKCARMGYRPWAKAANCTGAGSKRTCTDVALTEHHQACTRMMRADYCGIGKSYTVNGTQIDIYDYLNPPIQVPETDWDIEARWTPTGAICINEPRHPELVGKWKRPDCNGDGKPDNFPSCGQSDNRYSGKGLLVDRFDDDQSGCKK